MPSPAGVTGGFAIRWPRWRVRSARSGLASAMDWFQTRTRSVHHIAPFRGIILEARVHGQSTKLLAWINAKEG